MRVVVLTMGLGLSLAGFAVAQEANATVQSAREYTRIPAEDLGTALKELATERKFQILYRSDSVKNLRTRGAEGTLTPAEALAALLQGTGLMYRYVDARTVMITPPGSFGGDALQRRTTTQDSDANSGSTTKKAQRSFSGSFLLAQVDSGQAANAGSVEAKEQRSGLLQESSSLPRSARSAFRTCPSACRW